MCRSSGPTGSTRRPGRKAANRVDDKDAGQAHKRGHHQGVDQQGQGHGGSPFESGLIYWFYPRA